MLKLEQVSKLYRNNHGLQKTSITFQEGQITGILGRNGSGKTTLLKAILKPSANRQRCSILQWKKYRRTI